MKPPIRKAFLSPVRRGRIPAVSLARAVVYSTSSSVIITTEIIFLDLETLGVVLSCSWYAKKDLSSEEDERTSFVFIGDDSFHFQYRVARILLITILLLF